MSKYLLKFVSKHKSTLKKDWLLFITGIVMAYLSFPNIHFHLGFLGWICFVPILLLVNKQKTNFKGFGIAWIFFQILFLLLLAMNPFKYPERYESIFVIIGLLSFYLLFPLIYAFLFLLYKKIIATNNNLFVAFLFPSVWVAFEWVLTITPISIPISIAISQYKYYPLIQICRFTGIYGVSFMIILVNILVAHKIEYKSKHLYKILFAIIILFLALNIFSDKDNGKPGAKLTLIQPNINWQTAYYSKENNFLFRKTLSNLSRLTKKATENHSDSIVIWPELSITDFNIDNPLIHNAIEAILDRNIALIAGVRLKDKNSIVSIDKKGQITGLYQKIINVPFFEPIQKDNSPKALRIHNHNYKLGAFICYEMLLPNISRQLTIGGAKLLGGLSFNTWLGNTNWALLHMAYLPFRAIENNRYSFYLNNNGPSAVSNNRGALLDILPLNNRGYLSVKSKIITKLSFYTKYGDIFVLLCIIFNFIIMSYLFAIKRFPIVFNRLIKAKTLC
jgi:apolipoprotein N-acyltransferase